MATPARSPPATETRSRVRQRWRQRNLLGASASAAALLLAVAFPSFLLKQGHHVALAAASVGITSPHRPHAALTAAVSLATLVLYPSPVLAQVEDDGMGGQKDDIFEKEVGEAAQKECPAGRKPCAKRKNKCCPIKEKGGLGCKEKGMRKCKKKPNKCCKKKGGGGKNGGKNGGGGGGGGGALAKCRKGCKKRGDCAKCKPLADCRKGCKKRGPGECEACDAKYGEGVTESTGVPTAVPSVMPTPRPTDTPTLIPTGTPTLKPTPFPTVQPTMRPTSPQPTKAPSPEIQSVDRSTIPATALLEGDPSPGGWRPDRVKISNGIILNVYNSHGLNADDVLEGKKPEGTSYTFEELLMSAVRLALEDKYDVSYYAWSFVEEQAADVALGRSAPGGGNGRRTLTRAVEFPRGPRRPSDELVDRVFSEEIEARAQGPSRRQMASSPISTENSQGWGVRRFAQQTGGGAGTGAGKKTTGDGADGGDGDGADGGGDGIGDGDGDNSSPPTASPVAAPPPPTPAPIQMTHRWNEVYISPEGSPKITAGNAMFACPSTVPQTERDGSQNSCQEYQLELTVIVRDFDPTNTPILRDQIRQNVTQRFNEAVNDGTIWNKLKFLEDRVGAEENLKIIGSPQPTPQSDFFTSLGTTISSSVNDTLALPAIIGIAVGGAVVLCCCCVLCVYFFRKRRNVVGDKQGSITGDEEEW